MDTEDFYRFFDWMNKGAAAAAFAFFGLAAPSGEVEALTWLIATSLLIFSMLTLTSAIITGKQVSECSRDHRNIPTMVERIYIVTTGLGLAAFVLAIALFAFLMSPWLILPFILGLSVLVLSLRHVHNELLSRKV